MAIQFPRPQFPVPFGRKVPEKSAPVPRPVTPQAHSAALDVKRNADAFEALPKKDDADAGAAIRDAAMDIVNSRGPRAERDEGRGSGDGDGDSGGGGGDHGAPGLDVAGGVGLPGGSSLPGSVLSTAPVSL